LVYRENLRNSTEKGTHKDEGRKSVGRISRREAGDKKKKKNKVKEAKEEEKDARAKMHGKRKRGKEREEKKRSDVR